VLEYFIGVVIFVDPGSVQVCLCSVSAPVRTPRIHTSSSHFNLFSFSVSFPGARADSHTIVNSDLDFLSSAAELIFPG
jgi:hypothetical protein